MRSAANSRPNVPCDSFSPVIACPPPSISRMSKPTGPSLGSRVRCAVRPFAARCSTSRRACVVVPAPSRPSRTIRRPALTPASYHTDGEQTESAKQRGGGGVQKPDRPVRVGLVGGGHRGCVLGAQRDRPAKLGAAVLALRLERLAERVVVTGERLVRGRALRIEAIGLRVRRGRVAPLARVLELTAELEVDRRHLNLLGPIRV